MQIQLEKTLDVEVVERRLAELWKQTSGGVAPADDFAVLRARVANLMVYVAKESSLTEAHGIIAELTAMHPSRVLLVLGDYKKPDRDIQMALETFCIKDKRTGAQRLCCEEVTLKAAGHFVAELPSAALPLLVPDLTTFLWWRAALAADKEDKVFDTLLGASERLIVDSAEFADPHPDLIALAELFNGQNYNHVGISDLNWARLTSWRALLASFYDVPSYQPLLDRVDTVRIDYLAPEPAQARSGQDEHPIGAAPMGTPLARAHSATAIAPQALLIAGWLASRLGWTLTQEPPTRDERSTTIFNFFRNARHKTPGEDRGSGPTKVRGTSPTKVRGTSPTESRGTSPTVREGSNSNDRYINLELNRVERAEGKPGRLVQVELQSNSGKPASFSVSRSADNLHLSTEARVGPDTHRGRVLPVRNRSAAQLLGREMEILCNDEIYQKAVAIAAMMIDRFKTSH